MTYLAIPKIGQKMPLPTEFIPIPVPRPEIPPTTESTMPLERPQMAADALFSEAGRVVAPEVQIDLLSLPRGLELIKAKWNLFMNWNTELLSQFYGWLPDVTPTTNHTGIFMGIIFMGLAAIWFVTRD